MCIIWRTVLSGGELRSRRSRRLHLDTELRIILTVASRCADARGRDIADPAAKAVERRGVHCKSGMAYCPLACLPVASVWWLLLCSPRQLSARNAARTAYRSVVLSRRPSNLQSPAGLPCRQPARLACLDRGHCCRGVFGQEHGGRRWRFARDRCDLAQRNSL